MCFLAVWTKSVTFDTLVSSINGGEWWVCKPMHCRNEKVLFWRPRKFHQWGLLNFWKLMQVSAHYSKTFELLAKSCLILGKILGSHAVTLAFRVLLVKMRTKQKWKKYADKYCLNWALACTKARFWPFWGARKWPLQEHSERQGDGMVSRGGAKVTPRFAKMS